MSDRQGVGDKDFEVQGRDIQTRGSSVCSSLNRCGPSLPNSIPARGVMEGHAQRPDTRPIENPARTEKNACQTGSIRTRHDIQDADGGGIHRISSSIIRSAIQPTMPVASSTSSSNTAPGSHLNRSDRVSMLKERLNPVATGRSVSPMRAFVATVGSDLNNLILRHFQAHTT